MMHALSFIKDYRDNEKYRRGFNALTRRTYGIDFEDWYQAGHWGGAYIPYSFANGDQIVANVSVNLMRLVINGKDFSAIQLGTVMTDMAYRNRGLSRELMNIILPEYEDTRDFIYLFANDSVLEFYPKFGFQIVTEYECRTISGKASGMTRRKLNMDDAGDKALLFRLVDSAVPSGKIGCRHDRGLVMFYCSSFYRDSIWYLPELDLAAVAEESDGALHLIEVFCETDINLNAVIGALADEGTKIVLGFTPQDDDDRLILTPKTDDNDTLFIRSRHPLTLPKAMFPALSKA